MWSLRSTCIFGVTLSLAAFSNAKQCAQFDTSANLYLFGGEQDYNLGQNTSWTSPSPKALTTQGRPPWTGNNTICALSQYNNALYVLDADSANPGDIYVFDFGAGTWSKQSTTTAPDLTTGSSILDHDTNVFFTLPASGSLYSLDMSTVTTAATGSALPWQAVEDPNFTTGGAQPVLAEASNHIMFFNVPADPSGSANMFVIHYSYFQPEVQAFAEAGGAAANFPTTHGQAIPIPLASNNAGDQVVFIPDDASHTYVVTHWTSPSNYADVTDAPAGIANFINTTQTLPPPSLVDPAASYAASDTTLVQLSSAGDVYYLPAAFGNGYAVQSSATWQKLDFTLAGLSGSTSPSSSTVSSSGMGSSTSTTPSTSSTSSASSAQSMMSTTSTVAGSSAAKSSPTQTGGSLALVGPFANVSTWSYVLLLMTAVSAAWL